MMKVDVTMKQTVKQRSAFTLLEILIATGIFMTVMVVAVGIFTLTVSGSSTSEQMRINSQSARFAFESITREARLARGLTYTSTSDNIPRMIIPPFEVSYTGNVNCVNPSTNEAVVTVYQVRSVGATSSGQAQYTITRRRYQRDTNTKRLVLTTEEAYKETPATAADIYAAIQTGDPDLPSLERIGGEDGWTVVSAGDAVLPSNLIADQFRLTCFRSYPASGQSMDQLTAQPFIQLDLTVLNQKYNQNRPEEKQVKATFRTMIVPRNFTGPLEVTQPGVQGGE